MAKRSRDRVKRRTKAAMRPKHKAVNRTAPSNNTSARHAAVLTEPDIRRILPTQDWIAKIDSTQLNAVADVQKLAVSHFYNGLIQLRKNFVGNLFFPPSQNQLARELHGVLFLPDSTPAARIAVSVLPVTDASNNVVQIPETTVTDPQGQFVLR